MGIGVFALVARIITIGTGHLRCIMEVDIVDTVVIRTIDEDIGVIDVACDESVILTANTHVVAALEDRPYEIGIVRRRTGYDAKALIIRREITEGVRPVEFTGLAILDIEGSGVHTIPHNEQGGVLTLRINDQILRFLDSRGIDLEVIDRDRRAAGGIGGVDILPDEDEHKGLGRVSTGDAHLFGEGDVLPYLATADIFLVIVTERDAGRYLSGIGELVIGRMDNIIHDLGAGRSTGREELRLKAIHDEEAGSGGVTFSLPIKADIVFL